MFEQIKTAPVIPVFFHPDASHAIRVLKACYDGGIRCFEFTNRGKEAPEVFRQLKNYAATHLPGLSLGVGTIYSGTDAALFLEAGADFIVQPVTTAGVGSICKAHGKPWIPGALTPNEIWSAWHLGATAVKIFPSGPVGPDYIRALRGPMPHIPMIVTGGISPTQDVIRSWLDAGVQAVGLGSQLFQTKEPGDLAELILRISVLLDGLQRPASL